MGINKYRDWDVLDEMPEGWQIEKHAGSPYPYSVFINNGKSIFNGKKTAILKVEKVITEFKSKPFSPKLSEKAEQNNTPFPAKSVNDLARLKFKGYLLKEILVDLMICEIEGWNKIEYIHELKELINSIKTN